MGPEAVRSLSRALALLSSSPLKYSPSSSPRFSRETGNLELRNLSNTEKAKQNSSVGGHGTQPTRSQAPPCTMRTLNFRYRFIGKGKAGAQKGISKSRFIQSFRLYVGIYLPSLPLKEFH